MCEFYFCFFSTDVHTKATPTTKSLDGTSDQDDCVIVNPPTTPQQTAKCTPTKTQVQIASKSNNGQKFPSSCQEESHLTASQGSPFQKLGNPEIKTTIETSPASPFQKIGNTESSTDKIVEPQGNNSLCGSLPSGERDKTGLHAALFSPKVSLHIKQTSSGGSSMDLLKDNASLGQAIDTVENDREKTFSKNQSDVTGGRFNKGDGAEIPRQRILSGESQRYSAKGWLARVEKKRHQSEDTRFKSENSSPLKHRESTDSGSTAGQDRKQHSMHRSQSDSSQEITPESAQTYKEYREAKQRLLEKEKEEESRRRSQQKLSSSSSETQGGGVRQGSAQKTAESYPSNASRGGQAVDSMDMIDSKFCIVYGANIPSPEDDGKNSSISIYSISSCNILFHWLN